MKAALRSSFIFVDMDGQDTFDFPPKTDSVELTARAVSLFVFIAEVACLLLIDPHYCHNLCD